MFAENDTFNHQKLDFNHLKIGFYHDLSWFVHWIVSIRPYLHENGVYPQLTYLMLGIWQLARGFSGPQHFQTNQCVSLMMGMNFMWGMILLTLYGRVWHVVLEVWIPEAFRSVLPTTVNLRCFGLEEANIESVHWVNSYSQQEQIFSQWNVTNPPKNPQELVNIAFALVARKHRKHGGSTAPRDGHCSWNSESWMSMAAMVKTMK